MRIAKCVLSLALAVLTVFSVVSYVAAQPPIDVVTQPYLLDTGLISRSISFENPSGAPGEGGKAASKLGVGRKGSPARTMKPGDVQQLCDIQDGPGTIRHIWVTTAREPANLRSMVIRAWWDGQEHPSIECPMGDFMGMAHGRVMPHQSAVHSVGGLAFNATPLPAGPRNWGQFFSASSIIAPEHETVQQLAIMANGSIIV